MVLRYSRKGYRVQQEYDGLEYGLWYLVGAARFGSSLVIDALTTMEPVTITPKPTGK
jgi:hypothetical protein